MAIRDWFRNFEVQNTVAGWIGWNLNLFFAVNKYIYLGSCSSIDSGISEISSRIQEGRLVVTNLRYLWSRLEVRLSGKDSAYIAQ